MPEAGVQAEVEDEVSAELLVVILMGLVEEEVAVDHSVEARLLEEGDGKMLLESQSDLIEDNMTMKGI